MAKTLKDLEHAIRIRYRIPPTAQIGAASMEKVIRELHAIAKDHLPTDDEWETVVTRNIQWTGKHVTAGEDMTILNSVLMQIALPRPPISGTQTK
jgi:hypothetical protein